MQPGADSIMSPSLLVIDDLEGHHKHLTKEEVLRMYEEWVAAKKRNYPAQASLKPTHPLDGALGGSSE